MGRGRTGSKDPFTIFNSMNKTCPHCECYMEDISTMIPEPITFKEHIEQGCPMLASLDQLELPLIIHRHHNTDKSFTSKIIKWLKKITHR